MKSQKKQLKIKGKKIDALKDLKPKEQTKPIEDKPNNKSKAAIILDNLINKRKDLMKELYDSIDHVNLKFEFVCPTNDVSFYEYRDSKELFNGIIDNQINLDDALKRQNKLVRKISNVKIGKKTDNKKKVINNLENFYISKEEIINFYRDYGKMVLDAAYKSKQNETEGKGLEILTPKQMLQRLTIAVALESLLNEIRQIIYFLYESKQITKKLYNNIIKSI